MWQHQGFSDLGGFVAPTLDSLQPDSQSSSAAWGAGVTTGILVTRRRLVSAGVSLAGGISCWWVVSGWLWMFLPYLRALPAQGT